MAFAPVMVSAEKQSDSGSDIVRFFISIFSLDTFCYDIPVATPGRQQASYNLINYRYGRLAVMPDSRSY